MYSKSQSQTRLSALEQIYQQARLTVHQRRQQQIMVQQHMVALQLERGADPMTLAAVLAEQLAHAQLASAQDM